MSGSCSRLARNEIRQCNDLFLYSVDMFPRAVNKDTDSFFSV